MNIFVLDRDARRAARDHCDKHLVKMVIEYAQMLSTAHRLLDGSLVVATDSEKRVKPKKLWLLDGEVPIVRTIEGDEAGAVTNRWEVQNSRCYQVAHANHPCSIWTRETTSNYSWLFRLFESSLNEYTTRYGKRHATERIVEFLSAPPANIRSDGMTPFAQAMPEEYKHADAVQAYRRFYAGAKSRFAKWRYTPVPEWYLNLMERQDVTNVT